MTRGLEMSIDCLLYILFKENVLNLQSDGRFATQQRICHLRKRPRFTTRINPTKDKSTSPKCHLQSPIVIVFHNSPCHHRTLTYYIPALNPSPPLPLVPQGDKMTFTDWGKLWLAEPSTGGHVSVIDTG